FFRPELAAPDFFERPPFDVAFRAMLTSRYARIGNCPPVVVSLSGPLEYVGHTPERPFAVHAHCVAATTPDRCGAVLSALVHRVELDIEVRTSLPVEQSSLDRPPDDPLAGFEACIGRTPSRPHGLDDDVRPARLDHGLPTP